MTKARIKKFVMRPERRTVSLRGFALGDGRDSDVQVADLSYGGCRIDSNDVFKAGEVVELRVVKRGMIYAEIRWASGGRAGARFIN